MNAIACSNGHQNPRQARFCSRCGEALAVQATLLLGTQLRDRYIIRRPLGQGGFGSTYLAEDTGRFNELVAIKELTPSAQGTYALQKAEEMFQQEAATLNKLWHPQIPRFWEFFREGKRLFLVQDYIEGETYQSLLDERLASSQRFSEAEILELLRQILPVLSYLHSLNIIHRDISPDNIIRRSQDGLPVLIDLGGVKQVANKVATQVAGSQNSAAPKVYTCGTRVGKVGYAPDEQMQLGIAAPHSDLYALGVTAVVLMTGKQPHELLDSHTLTWTWNRELTLSKLLSGILNRMLAPRPSERFHCAEEILELLNANSTESQGQQKNSAAQNPVPIANSAPNILLKNNSGQGHLLDGSVPLPPEIAGWNWGAFLLPGVWCLTNQVWIGLLAWSDLTLLTCFMAWPTMAVILGIKGNEWAWKSRHWKSIAAFKTHQRMWAIASFLFVLSILLLILLIFVLIFIFVGMAAIGR